MNILVLWIGFILGFLVGLYIIPPAHASGNPTQVVDGRKGYYENK